MFSPSKSDRAKLLTVLALVALASCSKKNSSSGSDESAHETEAAAPAAPAEPELEWFRAQTRTDRPVVFQVGLTPVTMAEGHAIFPNGASKLRFPMTCEASSCEVKFEIYGASLSMDRSTPGTIQARWHVDPLYYEGRTEPILIEGTSIPDDTIAQRLPAAAAPGFDFHGEWVITFADIDRTGVVRFDQNDDGTATGFIITEGAGDLDRQAGQVSGKTIHVTRFDGQRALTVEATAQDDGTIEGRLYNPYQYDLPFTGKRDADAPGMFDTLFANRLKDGFKSVELPELEALRGKPVIVDLFGSWCPSCQELEPLLLEIYEEHHDDGLEIVGIAYEASDDEEVIKERIAQFHQKFPVPWKTTYRVGTDIAALLPKEIEPVGMPTVIFVNRDGTVHMVTSGFLTPADEGRHKTLRSAYHKWTKAIMASPASPEDGDGAGAD
jgi:thiol-disulfide isomerase/thioredoxin